MEELDAVSVERGSLADGSAQNGSLPPVLTSDWLEEDVEMLLWSSPATAVLQLYVEAEEDEKVGASRLSPAASGKEGGKRAEAPVLLARLH